MNNRRKRWIARAIQFSVTIGALILIYRSVDFKIIPVLMSSADLTHILLALIFALAQFFVGAWRWQQLIYLLNGRMVPLGYLFNSYITSFFVSSILPGTITGDFVRVYDTRYQADGSAKSASIILIERLLGLIILIGLCILSWIGMDQQPFKTINFRSLLRVFIGLVAFLVLIFWWLKRHPINKWVKIIIWFKSFIISVFSISSMMLKKPIESLIIVAATVIYQMLALLIIFETLQAFNVSVSYRLFFTVAPLVSLVITLPISIQGLGVRESLYITLLSPYGIDLEAVLVGLSFTYLVGLPFILWGWLLYSQRVKIKADNLKVNGSL